MKRSQKMQISDEISYVDWRPIKGLVAVSSALIIGLFILVNTSYIDMLWSTRTMDGLVEARVVDRSEQFAISSSLSGAKTRLAYIKCDYEYDVNGNKYHSTGYLTPSLLNSGQFESIRVSNLPVKVNVKFEKHRPYKSTIWLP